MKFIGPKLQLTKLKSIICNFTFFSKKEIFLTKKLAVTTSANLHDQNDKNEI